MPLWCSVMPRVQHSWARSARAYACANCRIAAAGTPVTFSASDSVQGSTSALYSSKPLVARSMKAWLARPAWMISRPIACAIGMSVPTFRPSQLSAHSAVDVRRGSTAYIRAPFLIPFSTCWKKIGCAKRALEPHITMRSVSSTSAYEEVPPPEPKAALRPATLGAWQVRLQESTLFVPITTRANFWAT